MRDFDQAIHDAHVRQVQEARAFTGWLSVFLGGIAVGMALAAWVMGGGV